MITSLNLQLLKEIFKISISQTQEISLAYTRPLTLNNTINVLFISSGSQK